MIKIRIRNDDHEIDIRFPISESELFAKLGEIHAVEGRDAAQFALVTEVYWPEEFDELEELYDGHTFPEYYYNNSLLSLNAEYGGRTELLQLPDEALAIKKAIDRLGAPSAEDCSYTVTFHNFKGDDWLARVQEIIAKEGIYETNAMLKALDVEGMDWSKLSAVVELSGVQKASNIAYLAEHLDEFSFIPEAKTEEDVGHYLVDNISEYRLNLEMEDYFDFSGFGEHIAEEHDGQFVEGGFIYYDSYDSLDELLDGLDPEDEGMNMGGM